MTTRIVLFLAIVAVIALSAVVVVDTFHPFTVSESAYIEKAAQWQKSISLFYCGAALQDYLTGRRSKVHVRLRADGFQAIFDKWSADIVRTKPPESYQGIHIEFITIIDDYNNYLDNIIHYLYSESLPSILTDETLPEARSTDWYQELEKLHKEFFQKLEKLKMSINEAENKINNEAAVLGAQ
jgi:hypothetical protein